MVVRVLWRAISGGLGGSGAALVVALVFPDWVGELGIRTTVLATGLLGLVAAPLAFVLDALADRSLQKKERESE